MQDKSLRDAVRNLRRSIKTADGEPISQTEFGRRIGKSLNTVQRYEGLVPPKGAMLVQLHQVALKHEQPELANIFWDAAAAELGQNSPQRILDIRNKAMNALAAHRKGLPVNPFAVLEEIADIVLEISPGAQWFVGRHLKSEPTE